MHSLRRKLQFGDLGNAGYSENHWENGHVWWRNSAAFRLLAGKRDRHAPS
jgi:hypothetical protein